MKQNNTVTIELYRRPTRQFTRDCITSLPEKSEGEHKYCWHYNLDKRNI